MDKYEYINNSLKNVIAEIETAYKDLKNLTDRYNFIGEGPYYSADELMHKALEMLYKSKKETEKEIERIEVEKRWGVDFFASKLKCN